MNRYFNAAIVMHKDVCQFERLLRAIYRPSNYYCIHLDGKSNVLKSVEALANCFPGRVGVLSKVNVTWGDASVLVANLECMQWLVNKGEWKYFINLVGQEFPLKTNLQLIRILMAINGANIIDGSRKRFQFVNFMKSSH